MTNYKSDLSNRYLKYQLDHFPDVERYFEHPKGLYCRPLVFRSCESWRNIIIEPNTSQAAKLALSFLHKTSG